MSKFISINGFITNIKNIFIIFLVLVLVGGVFTFIKNRKSLINDYETLLSDTTQYYIQHRVVDGKTISEQNQKITSLRAAVVTGEVKIKDLENRNFKSVNTIIRLKTVNTILTDSIEYLSQPSVVVIKDSLGVPNDYMKVPIKFAKDNKWYSIFGGVHKSGVLIDSLWMLSEPTLYIGKQWKDEKGLFRKLKGTKNVITYENANPYITVISMENNVIIEPDKWYEKGWFKFLLGAAAGTGTAIIVTK